VRCLLHQSEGQHGKADQGIGAGYLGDHLIKITFIS
jgi:hypothetical protein